jgi:hypothetical protein
VDDVGITTKLGQIIAAQRLRLEKLRVTCRARHRVDAKRRTVATPGRDREDVVRQAAANDLGHFVEHVTDIERARHRLEQSSQAVDSLAPQFLAIDDGIVFERESEQIDDVVHQSLMGSAEGALAARREPQSPVHAGALPDGTDDA